VFVPGHLLRAKAAVGTGKRAMFMIGSGLRLCQSQALEPLLSKLLLAICSGQSSYFLPGKFAHRWLMSLKVHGIFELAIDLQRRKCMRQTI